MNSCKTILYSLTWNTSFIAATETSDLSHSLNTQMWPTVMAPWADLWRACATNVPLIWFYDELLSNCLLSPLPLLHSLRQSNTLSRNFCGPRDCFRICEGKLNLVGGMRRPYHPHHPCLSTPPPLSPPPLCAPDSACNMRNLCVRQRRHAAHGVGTRQQLRHPHDFKADSFHCAFPWASFWVSCPVLSLPFPLVLLLFPPLLMLLLILILLHLLQFRFLLMLQLPILFMLSLVLMLLLIPRLLILLFLLLLLSLPTLSPPVAPPTAWPQSDMRQPTADSRWWNI